MKKVLNILSDVLFWIIVISSVGMMIFTIVSVSTFNRNDRNVFGYKAFIVLSDSMKATDFASGDLVIVQQVNDPRTIKAGDIISFTSQNTSNYGEVVTHKVRSVTTTEEGDIAFVTYGTTTGTDDETPVTFPFLIGKYRFALPKVGSFFLFLKTPTGYVVFILVPFLALIIYQMVRCVILFKKYKKLQMKKLRAEKKKIEAERAEAKKMQEELEALKAQLASQENKNISSIE